MLFSQNYSTFTTLAFSLLVVCGAVAGEEVYSDINQNDKMKSEVAKLRKQNDVLSATITTARKNEQQAFEELVQIKKRLEALGKNLLDGGNDRLVQAASDQQILQERLSSIERVASNLISSTNDFVTKAVVSDPEARLRLETSSRELDAVLGLRNKPQPNIKIGSLQRAQVISVDTDSGLLVINAGKEQNCNIGMTYSLQRGDRLYGKAVVADVRKNVSGAFTENILSPNEIVRIGDTVTLETQQGKSER
jgi:hypothetical protein